MRKNAGDVVEMQLGPHPAREGWAVFRMTYDLRNPVHEAQAQAAIRAAVQARQSLIKERETAV